jgi:predicted ATPase
VTADSAAFDPPYLRGVRLPPERVPEAGGFPFDLACVRDLEVTFPTAVTFLVGENGSGKSTLTEAIAEVAGLPPSGGSKNELPDRTGPEDHSRLGELLRPVFTRRPRSGYFFRSEHTAHFGELLVQRKGEHTDRRRDPLADPDDLPRRDHPLARWRSALTHRARGHGALPADP